jgi:hypothetical protein
VLGGVALLFSSRAAGTDPQPPAPCRCHSEMMALEAEMLANVSDQTTVEKGAQRTLKDVNVTRTQVQEHYVTAVQLQNELAKIKVDLLNTQVRAPSDTSWCRNAASLSRCPVSNLERLGWAHPGDKHQAPVVPADE